MVLGEGLTSFFFNVDIQFPHHQLLKRLSFPPLNGFGILVRNHLTVYANIYFWALYSVGLYVLLFASTTLF